MGDKRERRTGRKEEIRAGRRGTRRKEGEREKEKEREGKREGRKGWREGKDGDLRVNFCNFRNCLVRCNLGAY